MIIRLPLKGVLDRIAAKRTEFSKIFMLENPSHSTQLSTPKNAFMQYACPSDRVAKLLACWFNSAKGSACQEFGKCSLCTDEVFYEDREICREDLIPYDGDRQHAGAALPPSELLKYCISNSPG
jgi:hypothetical protein